MMGHTAAKRRYDSDNVFNVSALLFVADPRGNGRCGMTHTSGDKNSAQVFARR
jgi:hypothetical protein